MNVSSVHIINIHSLKKGLLTYVLQTNAQLHSVTCVNCIICTLDSLPQLILTSLSYIISLHSKIHDDFNHTQEVLKIIRLLELKTIENIIFSSSEPSNGNGTSIPGILRLRHKRIRTHSF